IADTWLHAATSSIVLSQVKEIGSPTSTFGRGLYSHQCDSTYPCSVSTGNHGTGLINGPEALKTLANTSSQNLVLSFKHKSQTVGFITDAYVSQDMDFQAHTFAVATTCRLITTKCGAQMGPVGSTPFRCSSAFSGDLSGFGCSSTNGIPHMSGITFFQ